jgi:hypothetical protein
MMKRREFITLLGGAAEWPFDAQAQNLERMRRIGVLLGLATSDPEAQSRVTALETALRELGWVKGRNLSIEYRWPGEWKHRAQPCKQGSRSVGQHALVFTARKCTYEGAPQVCPSNRTTRKLDVAAMA